MSWQQQCTPRTLLTGTSADDACPAVQVHFDLGSLQSEFIGMHALCSLSRLEEASLRLSMADYQAANPGVWHASGGLPALRRLDIACVCNTATGRSLADRAKHPCIVSHVACNSSHLGTQRPEAPSCQCAAGTHGAWMLCWRRQVRS